MNDATQNSPNRLDSWKVIAAYLNRDQRTVQRWERELGLPVRRLTGRGRSVFAYTSEIDAWLRTNQANLESPPAADVSAPPVRKVGLLSPLAVSAVILLAAGLAWRLRPASATAAELRVKVTTDGVVAFDARGAKRWDYPFPLAYSTYLAEQMAEPVRIAEGKNPAVYLATAHRVRGIDDAREGGPLTQLDLAGHEQRSFSFADTVTFAGTAFGPPWVITTFAIDDTGGPRRIAIAAHHDVWDASLVTVLDEEFHRHGTFVHAGWIEQLQWMAPSRLVIAGYSNAHDGGMVALLDPSAPGGIDGQGPEPAGTRYHCDTCASAGPLRMAIMPRTELNRITASRFNRARIEVTPRGILARTIEVPHPSPGLDAIDALYEFTPSLEFQRASFGDHYWEVLHAVKHQAASSRQTRPASPEKSGPAQILTWDPRAGWKMVVVR